MILKKSEVETIISALDAAIDNGIASSDPWNIKVTRLQDKLLKELQTV